MAEQKTTSGTITIGAAVIDRLLRDHKAVAEFSFLSNPPKRVYKTCCGGQTRRVDYETIKRHIGKLPTPKLDKVKELLGASKVRIIFREGRKMQSRTG